jgi:phasin
MLNLLLRTYWWAAWWPYGTWLLAMEKAMSRGTAGFKPPSQPQTNDRGQVGQQESIMSNDAFMKPEIPESLRDLMRMSIEQAKRAFDMFAATSEKTWKSLETTSLSARSGLMSLNTKIADITRSNAEANFALALKLAESKDINQAMELQSQHARKQMEAFVHQLEEMRDLAAQIIQEANPVKAEYTSSGGAASPSVNAGGSKPSAGTAPSFSPGNTPSRRY